MKKIKFLALALGLILAMPMFLTADEQKMDVVVVIGLGGTPESPAEVYAAPLYAIKKYTLARKKYLQQFKLADPKSNFRFILSKHTVEN